jgi:hypothetical protein
MLSTKASVINDEFSRAVSTVPYKEGFYKQTKSTNLIQNLQCKGLDYKKLSNEEKG